MKQQLTGLINPIFFQLILQQFNKQIACKMHNYFFKPQNLMLCPYLSCEQSYQMWNAFPNNIFLTENNFPLQSIFSYYQNNPINQSLQKNSHLQNNHIQLQIPKLNHKNSTFRIKKQKTSNYQKKYKKKQNKCRLIKNQHQKQNRNVFSNIFRNFFRRLKDFSKFIGIVDAIIQKRGLSLKTQQFFQYIRNLKIDHTKYIRFSYIKEVFRNQQLGQYNIILRIVFNDYIQGDGLIQTITSHRIGGWSLMNHLEGIRQINSKLYHQK